MICITRFNDKTYSENYEWRKKNNFTGCIYNTSIKISNQIMLDSIIIVLEMNNSRNKIMGIGLINSKNSFEFKRYKIYSDNNYNRFTYSSKYHIDIYNEYLPIKLFKIISILESKLFYTYRHCKRGHGIQSLPLWIKNIGFLNDFYNFILYCFKIKYINLSFN